MVPRDPCSKHWPQAKDLRIPPALDCQQLNHYFSGGCLTTKTGLLSCMQQLRWFCDMHQDEIMPRGYNLGDKEGQEVRPGWFWFGLCRAIS